MSADELEKHRQEQQANKVRFGGEDGLVHLRRTDDAPVTATAWCGQPLHMLVTVMDAVGYWGPDGRGWWQVCKACVAAKAAGHG